MYCKVFYFTYICIEKKHAQYIIWHIINADFVPYSIIHNAVKPPPGASVNGVLGNTFIALYLSGNGST